MLTVRKYRDEYNSLPDEAWATTIDESLSRVTKTVRGVIVNHAHGLHVGVTNRTADKLEAAFFKILAHLIRLRRGDRDVFKFFPVIDNRFAIDKLPDVVAKIAVFFHDGKINAGIGDRRIHFEPVANDGRIQ